uniref:F-box domain-containing protein n=1 Tax=Setaria italica TaxID=4555 RepID=K4A2R5_SETIT
MAKLVEETILLRVPPDNPACLTRASLVSKPWCRLLSDPTFGRCYCTFHRAPPCSASFTITYARLMIVPVGAYSTDAMGGNLVVWDPTTGKQQRLPEPPVELGAYNAAVLCAVRGCDHLDCRGDPFFVILVGYNQVLWLHLYSSEAGAWIASSHLVKFELQVFGIIE